MNSVQQRFLLNRLDEARRAKPSRYAAANLSEPKEVKAALAAKVSAEKIIKKWQNVCQRETDARNRAIDKAFATAKTAVMFGTSQDAIKAIEKFEALKF